MKQEKPSEITKLPSDDAEAAAFYMQKYVDTHNMWLKLADFVHARPYGDFERVLKEMCKLEEEYD